MANKQNVRLLDVSAHWPGEQQPALDFKRVNGGLLVQERDDGMVTRDNLTVVSQRAPSEQELRDLAFAWRVAKFVKSNAIVYAKEGQTVGVGAGQMSRVYSAKIAGIKAADEGLSVPGSVMASDAFFPFRDGIDAAAAAHYRHQTDTVKTSPHQQRADEGFFHPVLLKKEHLGLSQDQYIDTWFQGTLPSPDGRLHGLSLRL